MRGFSLLEILLSLALFAVLFGVGAPLLSGAYADFSLRSEEARFVNFLRRAEHFAFSNVGESPHGVSLQPDSFVLFRGSSYVSRESEYDEVYERSSRLSFSGPSEIIFSQRSGFPLAASDWLLTQGDIQVGNVRVNAYGAIFW